MAAPFSLRHGLDGLIRHFPWTPRGALNADRLGEYYFLSSVLVSLACHESARPKDVQGVAEIVDPRQGGQQPMDFRFGADVQGDRRLVEDEELDAVIKPLADHDLEGVSRTEMLVQLV